MKNRFTPAAYFLLFIFFLSSAFAQTGVKISASPGTADPSAMLDIESSSRGLLVPRVNLVALNNGTSPVANPATGLLVYNLGQGGVPSVGYYYWVGTAWVQLTAGGFSGAGTLNYVTKWTASNALGNSVLYDDGTNVGIGTSSPQTLFNLAGAHSTTRLRLTLPSAANLGNTGDVNLQLWASEPGVTWDAGGIGTNVNNDGVGSTGFGRLNAALGQSYIRFITNGGGMVFATTSNSGTNYQTMYLSDGTVRINNLAGTGTRTVYANANGVLLAEGSNTAVYGYTGADQTFTVPSGVTSITVKLWGGGGGSGYYGGWDGGFSGGGGGYTTGRIAVSAGQAYTIIVGGGGIASFQYVTSTANSYGGGSRGCNNGSDCRYGGQGGGRSAIRLSGTELMTAGGGGGGGASRDWTFYRCEGGAGGGLVGQDGVAVQNPAYRATGGTQSGGGGGGLNAQAGSQFTGGNPASNGYGGGGGGGWFGGGGGSYQEQNLMGGGGGGSGYIGGANVSNAYTIGGWNAQPGGNSDVNYVAGIGVGGITQYHSIGTTAGNGRVVIIY